MRRRDRQLATAVSRRSGAASRGDRRRRRRGERRDRRTARHRCLRRGSAARSRRARPSVRPPSGRPNRRRRRRPGGQGCAARAGTSGSCGHGRIVARIARTDHRARPRDPGIGDTTRDIPDGAARRPYCRSREPRAPPPARRPRAAPDAATGRRPAPAGRRILGGVAALLADRLGIDPLWVRIGFVLLALAGGIGLVLYAGLWLVLVAGADPDRPLGPGRRRRRARGRAAADADAGVHVLRRAVGGAGPAGRAGAGPLATARTAPRPAARSAVDAGVGRPTDAARRRAAPTRAAGRDVRRPDAASGRLRSSAA